MGVGLREEKKRLTRQAILDTAADLFREQGFTGTRVRDIIDPVGISKKTFFNYFASKEEVLRDLAQQWFNARMTEKGGEQADQQGSVAKGLSPRERIQVNLDRRIDVVIDERKFVAMLVKHTDLMSFKPELGTFGSSIGNNNTEEVLENFRLAQGHGEFRKDISAEEMHDMFTAVRNAIVTRWLGNRQATGEDLKQQINTALKVLMQGFAPEHSSI
jgi:AcrR family transcriptional regulator